MLPDIASVHIFFKQTENGKLGKKYDLQKNFTCRFLILKNAMNLYLRKS